MEAKWLIEDIFPEDETPMYKALDNQGIQYKTIQYKELWGVFEQAKYLYDNFYGPDECVIFYGSLRLARFLNNITAWVPGIFYQKGKFDCVNYYPKVNKYLVNSPYIMLPYEDIFNQKEFLYDCLGNNRCLFIRPERGDKLFTGQVVEKEKFDTKFKLLPPIDTKILVLVAEPVNIKYEWRFVVVESKVVTGSQYRKEGLAIQSEYYPQEALNLANEIAKINITTDSAWIIDICQLDNGDFKLMEVGCFSCAGLYKCNRNIVAKMVSEAALKQWKTYREF